MRDSALDRGQTLLPELSGGGYARRQSAKMAEHRCRFAGERL
jgi:hypothetical protein